MATKKFWIGDPCYHPALNARWAEFCDIIGDMAYVGVFEFDGRKVAISSTEYGDGTYDTSEDFQVGVDSGTVAAVEWKDGDAVPEDWMYLVDLDEDLDVEFENGVITFGGVISIYTGFESEEDEEEDYLEDEEFDEDDWD